MEFFAHFQLTELENRHDELLKLEQSLVELNGLFLELCELVTQQGDMVDHIEMSVANAKEYVSALTHRTKITQLLKRCSLSSHHFHRFSRS